MAMEPQTGNIKAWVGGINYKYFQYDHVGQGARQVGSTFKPFVYATAEQLNMSPGLDY
jgi:penicillin-binding protein 1A